MGRVATSSGTAAAPSFMFKEEMNTGTYRSSPGVIGESILGQETRTLSGTTETYFKHSGDTVSYEIAFKKSSGTKAVPTIVASGDVLGKLSAWGYDGSSYLEGGYVKFAVDASPGSGSMPCALVIGTTPNATSSPVERFRVNSAGNFGFGTSDLEAWHSDYRAFQLGGVSAVAFKTAASGIWFCDNLYYDGSWKYRTSGYAGYTLLDQGTVKFYSAPSGTADAAATMTCRFTLDVEGRIGAGNAGAVNSSYGLFVDGGASYGGAYFLSAYASGIALRAENSHASFAQCLLYMKAYRTADAAWSFGQWYSNNGADLEFKFSSDGNGSCDGAWTGGGADYAEMIEWADGNPRGEDRTERTVVFEGKCVRLSRPEDDPAKIIGIVSSKPGIVGNNPLIWPGKYLKNDFGGYVLDKDGQRIQAKKWDREEKYEERLGRREWAPIGCLGQLKVLKGEPKNPKWVLMSLGEKADLYWVR